MRVSRGCAQRTCGEQRGRSKKVVKLGGAQQLLRPHIEGHALVWTAVSRLLEARMAVTGPRLPYAQRGDKDNSGVEARHHSWKQKAERSENDIARRCSFAGATVDDLGKERLRTLLICIFLLRYSAQKRLLVITVNIV